MTMASAQESTLMCPYGWRCPAYSLIHKYGYSGPQTRRPLYELNKRCYVCKGLIKGEFQLFITVRPAPWAIMDEKTALRLLAKLAEELAKEADRLYLKAVIIIAVGKVVTRNNKLIARSEPPHIHILVGAKKRVGRFRVDRRTRIRRLMEFSHSQLKSLYAEVFGNVYPRCIDIKWIKYDDKVKTGKKRGVVRGRGKFRLRAYLFKQLIHQHYAPIVIGLHAKKRPNKTPSTEGSPPQNTNIIRDYTYACCFNAGGMGGYGGSAARLDDGLSARELFELVAKLRSGLSRGVFMDLPVNSDQLRTLLRRLLNIILARVRQEDADYSDILKFLYSMYTLVDVWNEMANASKLIYEGWSDEAVKEAARNYSVRLQVLVYDLLHLSYLDERSVADLLGFIVRSFRSRLEDALNIDGQVSGAGVEDLLRASMRLQILSKKRVRRLVRDLSYAEAILDKDLHNVAVSVVRVGNSVAEYIERSWKRLRKVAYSSDTRKRGRYGKRGSRELQFVRAVKALIRQIRMLKGVIEELEGIGNIRYLDRDNFVLEVETMMNNSSPCFIYAGRVICVDASNIKKVLDEATEVAKLATAYCRYCLGIRVKAPTKPCYEHSKECLSRFCSLYNELLYIVNGYRGLLKKLGSRLRSSAKVRKARYRSRFRKLLYKLSKARSLEEFAGGSRPDPFERAIAVFGSWLRRRGYKLLHEFDPNEALVRNATSTNTELYEMFTRIQDYISGFIDELERITPDTSAERDGQHYGSTTPRK